MDDVQIDYACPGCGRRLCAPSTWAGRMAGCPVCGTSVNIPVASTIEPDAGRYTVSVPTEKRVLVRDMPDMTFLALPSPPPPQTAPVKRVGFLRRWRLLIIILSLAAVGGAWAAGGSWFYRNHVKADGIMRHRGFGRQLSKDEVPVSESSRLTFRMSAAEAAVAKNPQDLQATLELMAAYDDAARSIGVFGRRHGARILNNAAWLYATSIHKGVRDPVKALELASRAVEQTRRWAPAMLDTLAEALLLNGRPTEALETIKEAAALDPENPELIKRVEYFQNAQIPLQL